MNETERRSARLLFGEELALGELSAEWLTRADVAEAVRDRPVPSRVGRWLQRRALARGDLAYEHFSVAPMLAARSAVLGERAAGPPRFLVRVEDGDDALHELLRTFEVPFLSPVLRRPTMELEVSVPPGDRLDAGGYTERAKSHVVVTGGPASVPTFGWYPTPLWRGDAVYAPAYLRGVDALGAVERLIAAEAALWVPLAIGPEDPEELVALLRVLRGYAREWDEFVAAVRASR